MHPQNGPKHARHASTTVAYPLLTNRTHILYYRHITVKEATPIATTATPKPRAGKAKDNLYRDTLDDDGIRILARAADRIGLADETQMLRVYVHKAMKKEDNSDLVRLLPILARIEEARLRIDDRPDAQPVDNPTLNALQAIVDQLKTLTKAENRI